MTQNFKNQSGAAMVEAVLIVILLFTLVQFVLGDNGIMKTLWMDELFEQPKLYLQGMARSGVWVSTKNLEKHPNVFNRHIMSKGEDIE